MRSTVATEVPPNFMTRRGRELPDIGHWAPINSRTLIGEGALDGLRRRSTGRQILPAADTLHEAKGRERQGASAPRGVSERGGEFKQKR
ncbi:hypothetical protein GCM10007874_36270 [Labrys miyagiensis]|uniref:Uncharacterized protein n=1 Tax=Labrys miyagiensis TaxID=346912 RepID=A0ABQ6CLB1_9HYPH|nr:hypothetical protein GCM10007874_36270 [Labrys miyagiensis]